MNKIVLVEDLRVGMFVEKVAKQSGNMVIKSQGIVKNHDVIDLLKDKGVESVEISINKSAIDIPTDASDATAPADLPTVTQTQSHDNEHGVFELEHEVIDLTDSSISLQDASKAPESFVPEPKPQKDHQDDLFKAESLYNQAREIQRKFVNDLRTGGAPDFEALNELSQDIIDSAFENPDALSCLMMLKNTDDYLVEHAINSSILLAIFARYKGFTQAEIEDITLAGLLMDVGMASLPSELLSKETSFSDADWGVIRSHVDIGFELVERFSDAPPIVLDVIKQHHERIDGSGYPKGKKGDEISIYAQMASIADSYDAMISDRAYKSSQNATMVLQALELDSSLDKQLVIEFTNAIGLHPVGSVVLLQSQRLAIVTQRVPNNPLRPNVMTFYNINTQLNTEIQRIELASTNDNIIGAVRPEEFKMNLSRFFKDVFLPSKS